MWSCDLLVSSINIPDISCWIRSGLSFFPPAPSPGSSAESLRDAGRRAEPVPDLIVFLKGDWEALVVLSILALIF